MFSVYHPFSWHELAPVMRSGDAYQRSEFHASLFLLPVNQCFYTGANWQYVVMLMLPDTEVMLALTQHSASIDLMLTRDRYLQVYANILGPTFLHPSLLGIRMTATVADRCCSRWTVRSYITRHCVLSKKSIRYILWVIKKYLILLLGGKNWWDTEGSRLFSEDS